MKVILVPFGSSGDVHPFVGLGAALRQRGHDITFLSIDHFVPMLQKHDFEVIQFGEEGRFEQVLSDPRLWHPTQALSVVVESIAKGLRPVYETIEQHYVPGETVVVAGTLALGARVAQEVLGVPLATVHLSPSIFRSVHDTPIHGPLRMPRWWPKLAKKGLYRLMDAMVDPKIAPELNRFRAEFGLRPTSRVMKDWWNSPQCVLALFPDWFAPPQPDWPPQTVQTGFPLYDEADIQELPAEVEAFLNQGKPPVLFAPGSAQTQGHDFFEASAKACSLSKARGIFVTRYPQQLPSPLPEGVAHFPYLPFSKILPRCSVLVHHGGVGTTAQGLAAGVPQLVRPMAHDQMDNAARLEALGVGATLIPKLYTAESASRTLESLIGSKSIHDRASELSRRVESQRALDATCLAIEQIPRT